MACKSSGSFSKRYKGMERESDHDTYNDVKGPYIQDPIIAAKLTIDSAKVYRELKDLLKFSRKLKYKGTDRMAFYYFTVETNGQITRDTHAATKGIEAQMNKVFDDLFSNLKECEPAHFEKRSSTKIPYRFHFAFYFYRDRIQFSLEGEYSNYYLRKSFAPNYKRITK